MEYVQVEGIGEVRIMVSVSPNDDSVRGNPISTDWDEYDTLIEDEIIRRLDNGDNWAWGVVAVTAFFALPSSGNILTVRGNDYLRGSSWDDEEDFCQASGCYEGMKKRAIADLKLQLIALKKALNLIRPEGYKLKHRRKDYSIRLRPHHCR